MRTMTRTKATAALTFGILLGLLTVPAPAETVTYSYDANGNLTHRTTQSGTSAHGYDALDRLTSDAIPNVPAVLIGYDANGNRTSQQLEGFGETYTYTPSTNRLIQKGAQTYTLDAAGNVTNDGQGKAYSYNNAGRLAHVQQNGATIASYIYNAQGQRTRKTTPTGITVYHYDLQGKLIAETLATGQHWRSYVYADDLPIAQIQATGSTEAIYYLHTDHLNTPRLATGTTGAVLWRWEGNAFGGLAPNQDPDGDGTATAIHLRFAGQYYDQESGLHYNWNRYYDPRVGRYVTSDPIGLAGGMNTYAYANNSPLVFIDPTGLEIVGSWIQKPFPVVTDARVSVGPGNARRPDGWWKIWKHMGTYRAMEHRVEVRAGYEWKVKCQETDECAADTWKIDGGWQEWMDVWVPIHAPAIPHPGGYYAFLGRSTYSLLIKPATSVAMDWATQAAQLFEMGNSPTTICRTMPRSHGSN